MLQICTGKLFFREIEYRNNLKGIIYTNLKLFKEQKIVTKAGTILCAETSTGPNAIIYEIEELIEKVEGGPGVLISHGIESLILDFSSILSFFLNCTASPSYSLTDRLLSDQIGVSTLTTPNKMVKRIFDKNIFYQEYDEKEFIKFTNHLIGLKRETYRGVMSSIRTYVTGMHRISDDFELAYTLLVASIESLAQNFDGHISTWEDFDQNKKRKIDDALSTANEEVKEEVRNAILSIEHSSLGRRFRDFSLKHIKPTFFREEVIEAINPISKSDLTIALKNAYNARSSYVHNLNKLPKRLVLSTYSETCIIKDETWLTLQGLSRLARHVIVDFVMSQPIIETEPYDYHMERSNIIQFEWAPEHWIAELDFSQGAGIRKLEAFLSQLSLCVSGVPNASITNLTNILEEFENKIDNLQAKDKNAFLALYIIYNAYIEESERTKNCQEFTKKHQNKISNPCTEGLIVNSLLGFPFHWEIEAHYECLNNYFLERSKKSKIRCPQIFESGMILQLVERYKQINDESKIIELIEMAVENHPSHKGLRQFEAEYKQQPKSIDRHEILFPEVKAENNKN